MTENTRVIEMLKTAVDMEEKGKKFYEKAISDCTNDLGKEIFAMLKSDEDIHIERIKKIYANLSGGKEWNNDWMKTNDTHSDLKVVFKKLANKYGKDITSSTSDIDALNVGIDFEQKSKEFYKTNLAKASNPIEKKFVEMMVLEEQGHFDTLQNMKFYLTDPESWFTENERHGLDGI